MRNETLLDTACVVAPGCSGLVTKIVTVVSLLTLRSVAGTVTSSCVDDLNVVLAGVASEPKLTTAPLTKPVPLMRITWAREDVGFCVIGAGTASCRVTAIVGKVVAMLMGAGTTGTTVIIADVPVTLPLAAVIDAVPGPTAVALPFASTVRTPVLLDAQ